MNKPLLPRLLILALGALCILSGLDAGLMRAQLWAPVSGQGSFALRLASLHGPLMLVGFMGTVIALERAVAARSAWAFTAPVGLGAGSLALLAGMPGMIAFALLLAGCWGLTLIYAAAYQRSPSAALDVETLGALSLLIGTLGWAVGGDISRVVPLWLAFPILTIVGERLELARIAFLDKAVEVTVATLALLLVLGGCIAAVLPWSHLLVGPVTLGLAVVMAWYDVARRTIRSRGMQRFSAACMLLGYLWLALAGAVWSGASLSGMNGSAYEIVIHCVSVGFAFSMIFAHAPIIIPAIVHRPLPFHPLMWLPCLALHVGLAVRVGGLLTQVTRAWQVGAGVGVAAILAFLILTVLRLATAQRASSSRPAASPPPASRPAAQPAPRRGRRSEQIRRNGFIVAWLAAAGILALGVVGGPLASWGQWLPLHTLLLGGIGSAITVYSAHFADTLLHRPAWGGARLLDARLITHSVGSIVVLVGITAHLSVVAMTGVSIVIVAAVVGVVAIVVQYRRAVAPRLAALAIHYAVALLLLAVGATFGYLTSWAQDHGHLAASDRYYVAHTLTMLLGFVGTTVLGTLTVLWPTMLRTKMEPYAPAWTTRALPPLVVGTALMAAGSLAWPLATAGMVLYLAGALGVLIPAYRTARRVPPLSFATASAAAAMGWFLAVVIILGVGMGLAGEPEGMRDLIHALRVPLAAGFALQILGAALNYLTPVMLGGGPATTRVTNTIMNRWAAYRVTATNACLLIAVMPGISWPVRAACALVGGLVASYVVVGMGLSLRESIRRRRSGRDDLVAASIPIGPPSSPSTRGLGMTLSVPTTQAPASRPSLSGETK